MINANWIAAVFGVAGVIVLLGILPIVIFFGAIVSGLLFH